MEHVTDGTVVGVRLFFFFKQKTAYEIKECDWSSDVCSSDLRGFVALYTRSFVVCVSGVGLKLVVYKLHIDGAEAAGCG